MGDCENLKGMAATRGRISIKCRVLNMHRFEDDGVFDNENTHTFLPISKVVADAKVN